MIDGNGIPAPEFTTTPWSASGTATINARGSDMRSALEAGLRAVLSQTVAPTPPALDTGRSAPIHGEGDDPGSLFADLVEDLLGQIAYFGGGLHDVTLDGVLRREDGGYVGWGYASGSLEAASPDEVPRLLGVPTVHEDAIQGVTAQATLQRP